MINKTWVLLFTETLFGVFLLVRMIHYYRFRSQSVLHCFAWETVSGQIVNLSSVLEPCPQGIGSGGFHCCQYCTTIMLECLYYIVLISFLLAIAMWTFNSTLLPSLLNQTKRNTRYNSVHQEKWVISAISVLYYRIRRPLHFPTPLETITIVYNCSFPTIFGVDKSLGSLNEGRFLKKVFWFFIFHQPEFHQTICKKSQTHNCTLLTSLFRRLSLSQKIEFHLIRGLNLLFCLQRIFIATEYINEAHNASLNAIHVCK